MQNRYSFLWQCGVIVNIKIIITVALMIFIKNNTSYYCIGERINEMTAGVLKMPTSE